MIVMATSTTSSMAMAAAEHGGGSAFSALASFIDKVEHMPQTVGAAWLISSALYTTYATNAFLNYNKKPLPSQLLGDENDENARIQQPDEKPSQHSLTSPPPQPPHQVATATDNTRQRRLGVPAHRWSVTRPTLLTLVRFGGSLLLGLVAHADYWRIGQRIQETIKAAPAFWFPALCLFTANFSNAISLNRIGISLTYTSKCAIPLITVILALVVDGPAALPHGWALLSLVPIAVGIGAASWHAPTFEKAGFVAAMLSATAQSALNVSSKRAMMQTGIRGASTQRVMVAVALVIAIVVTWYENASHFADDDPTDESVAKQPESKDGDAQESTPVSEPLGMYAMAITAYHIEYVLSFMFVKLVSPVTYGACDAIRRLSIILAGRAMFGGKPLTPVNKAGIGLALLGALGYSVATTSTTKL